MDCCWAGKGAAQSSAVTKGYKPERARDMAVQHAAAAQQELSHPEDLTPGGTCGEECNWQAGLDKECRET